MTFDTVSVNATELPPPGACPSAWTCADIGTVAPGPGEPDPVRRHLERDRLRERHLGHRRLVPLRLPAAGGRRQHQRAGRVADQLQRLGQGRADDAADHRPGLALLRGLRHPGQRDRGAMADRAGRFHQPGHHDRHGARVRGDHQDRHHVLRLHLTRRQHLDAGARLDRNRCRT